MVYVYGDYLIFLMPCPSTGPKTFGAGQFFWIRSKIKLHLKEMSNLMANGKFWDLNMTKSF